MLTCSTEATESTFFYFLRKQNLTCNYNGRCVINAKTRKDCTKCRLEKCFAIGMRSDVIGSATSERQRKSSFGHSSRSLSGRNMDSSCTYQRHDERYPSIVTRNENVEYLPTVEEIPGSDSSSNSSDAPSRKILNSLNQDRLKQIRKPMFCEYDRRSPEPAVKRTCSDQSIRSLKAEEYQKSLLPLNHIRTGYCYKQNLNPDEVLHIEAVKDAAAAIRSRVFITDDVKCTNPVLAAMKLQSFGVDKLISGMARIDAFSNLNDGTKATLLKGAVAEMMLVRSSMHFDTGTKGWTISAFDAPDSNQSSSTCDKSSQLPLLPCHSRQSSSAIVPNVSLHLSVELFKHIPGPLNGSTIT